MSTVDRSLPASNTEAQAIAATYWPLLASALVLAAAIPWQMRWGPIPDTSWLITFCERLLAGDRLYVDIIETNPPFTVWLYMPAVYAAHLFGFAPEIAVQGYTYAVCILGLLFSGLIARRAAFAENAGLYALLPVFLALLVIFPGSTLSERENFGVALLLPLLVLMAWRASPGRTGPQWWIAILAGLCGSVIVLVKPYYAVIVLGPVLYIAWRNRSLRPLFAIENWVIGAICAIYLAAVLIYTPAFIDQILPMLADTYMKAKDLTIAVSRYGIGFLLALYLIRVLRPKLPLSPLVTVILIAAGSAFLPLIYQGKGWPYHAYPALALVLMALLVRASQSSVASGRSGLGFGQKVFVVLAIAANAVPFQDGGRPDAQLIATVRAAVDKPTVGAIGPGIEAGHPLTRLIGGKWLSIHCSDWLGATAAIFALIERSTGNVAGSEHYEAMEKNYLDMKFRELDAARPEVMLLQETDERWSRHVLDRPDFAAFMLNYRLLAQNDYVAVYLRDGSGRAAPAS